VNTGPSVSERGRVVAADGSGPKAAGIVSLAELTANMDAHLASGEFVFATLASDAGVPPEAFCAVREDEALTLILAREAAERLGYAWAHPCRRITLRVNSSLAAVGFLARICTALAQAGISANAVSAFHHDHLFVPPERAADAVEILQRLARDAREAP